MANCTDLFQSWRALPKRITEVPITDLERKNGKSNYGIGRTIRVLWTC